MVEGMQAVVIAEERAGRGRGSRRPARRSRFPTGRRPGRVNYAERYICASSWRRRIRFSHTISRWARSPTTWRRSSLWPARDRDRRTCHDRTSTIQRAFSFRFRANSSACLRSSALGRPLFSPPKYFRKLFVFHPAHPNSPMTGTPSPAASPGSASGYSSQSPRPQRRPGPRRSRR